MLRWITNRLTPRVTPYVPLDAEGRARAVAFAAELSVIDKDPYLMVADRGRRLISVFDDLRYDRSDMDMMAGPMRRHVVGALAPLGFRQVTGSVLENPDLDIRMLFPKFRALGASPFDAIRDTPRRAQDYYVLTPTQAACQIVQHYPVDEAVMRIKALVVRHPINLLRLSDYLEQMRDHQDFLRAIGHLKYVQRVAVESEPLRQRRALK
ncbi:hypothetical protein [Pacificoceanicola onchidii]|uniref:hypothetical protein n=1 Tax=Pacificoceanicola onchidii TaxID=2562685 RepID=UPI0010A3308D|nr:hypothetical protein [Pacificoceanicola onchidii]